MIPVSAPEQGGTGVDESRWGPAINRTTCAPELKARLDALQQRTGASQAWIVRKALEDYLDHIDKENA